MSRDAVPSDAVALRGVGVADRADAGDRVDVTPPGREKQVNKLKTVAGIDNPYAVAWSSYNSDDGPEWMGARCDACGQNVPVRGGVYDSHLAVVRDMPDKSALGDIGYADAAESPGLCPAGGATPSHADSISLRGGKWVVLAKSSGEVHGIYGTREEAEAQEKALASRGDDEEESARAEYEGIQDEFDPDQPREENGKWGAGGAGGGGEKVSEGEAKARASFHGPSEHAGSSSSRTAWYKAQTAKMKEERGGLKAKTKAIKKATKGDSVRRFEHIDFAPNELPKARITADGFLHVTGRVARTGIQEYRDGQGGVRKELRLPDEVTKSLPSFPLQPMTNTHPSEMVAPDNAQKYAVGAVGVPVMNDDGWVEAPLSVWRADAIDAVRNGRVQLSVGYSCRLDAVPGDWQGQHYDAIQRDIVVNHVALVDMARAGSEARLRLDAKDAVACDTTSRESLIKRTIEMAKLTIGGLIFEVQDANAQAAFDGHVGNLTKACDEKVAAEKLRADNADKLAVERTKERDAAQGRLDAKDAEDKQPIKFDGAEIPVVDAVDVAKFADFARPLIEARAQARASLIVEARKHLGANEKFDAHKDKAGKDVTAKSDTEIKRLVVQKLDPSAKLDGKSDEYVQARYDAAVERADKAPRAIDSARTVTAPTIAVETNDEAPLDPEAAYKAMVERTLRANVRHPKHDANGKV